MKCLGGLRNVESPSCVCDAGRLAFGVTIYLTTRYLCSLCIILRGSVVSNRTVKSR